MRSADWLAMLLVFGTPLIAVSWGLMALERRVRGLERRLGGRR